MSENNSEYILVDNAEKMQLVLASLASSSKIAIDTEFVRISTLHPIVALVQLNDGVNTFLVDPIILPPEQMELFWNHLTESETLLIFFAMHEDLDLIKFYSGRLPKRVVDLQWMAGFMGFSPKLGLASLVEKILGITILKDQTTSIWMQRPLTPDQLRYGAVDVKYLIQVYDLMQHKLEELGNDDYFQQDLQLQVETAVVPFDPRLGYLKYHADCLTAFETAKLRELVNFRQRIAEEKNICLKHVVPNHLLIKLCQKSVRNQITLQKIGLHWKSIREYGAELIKLLNHPPASYDYDGILDHPIPSPECKGELAQKLFDIFNSFADERGIDHGVMTSHKRLGELIVYLASTSSDRQFLDYPYLLRSKWRLDLIRDVLIQYFPFEPLLRAENGKVD
jgi:ribonuclease D